MSPGFPREHSRSDATQTRLSGEVLSRFLSGPSVYDRPPSLHSAPGVLPLLQATRAIPAYTQRLYHGHRAPNPSRAPSLAAACLRALLPSCARSAMHISVARTLQSPEPSLVGHKQACAVVAWLRHTRPSSAWDGDEPQRLRTSGGMANAVHVGLSALLRVLIPRQSEDGWGLAPHGRSAQGGADPR